MKAAKKVETATFICSLQDRIASLEYTLERLGRLDESANLSLGDAFHMTGAHMNSHCEILQDLPEEDYPLIIRYIVKMGKDFAKAKRVEVDALVPDTIEASGKIVRLNHQATVLESQVERFSVNLDEMTADFVYNQFKNHLDTANFQRLDRYIRNKARKCIRESRLWLADEGVEV